MATTTHERLTRAPLLALIHLYRLTLARFLGGHCRFQPTCSQYALDAINKYGAIKGTWKSLKRISKCRPWGPKGFDPA